MLLPVAIPFLVLSNMGRKVPGKKAWLRTLKITKTIAALSAPLEEIDQYHQQALEKSITNWYSKDVNGWLVWFLRRLSNHTSYLRLLQH